MKWVISIALTVSLLLAPRPGHAGTPEEAASARKLVIAGSVLLAVGVVCVVMGAVFAVQVSGLVRSQGEVGLDENIGRFVSATALTPFGAALTIIGVPLLGVGAHRLRKHKASLRVGLTGLTASF